MQTHLVDLFIEEVAKGLMPPPGSPERQAYQEWAGVDQGPAVAVDRTEQVVMASNRTVYVGRHRV